MSVFRETPLSPDILTRIMTTPYKIWELRLSGRHLHLQLIDTSWRVNLWKSLGLNLKPLFYSLILFASFFSVFHFFYCFSRLLTIDMNTFSLPIAFTKLSPSFSLYPPPLIFLNSLLFFLIGLPIFRCLYTSEEDLWTKC